MKRGINMRKKPKAVCTVGLIIVNIAVFMVLSLLGDTENGYFMLHHGAMYEPMILENQEYYRFLLVCSCILESSIC